MIDMHGRTRISFHSDNVVEHEKKIVLVEEDQDRRKVDAQQPHLGKLYLVVLLSIVAHTHSPTHTATHSHCHT